MGVPVALDTLSRAQVEGAIRRPFHRPAALLLEKHGMDTTCGGVYVLLITG